MGFGDDWKKALEHVKNLFVEPGKQPELATQLARHFAGDEETALKQRCASAPDSVQLRFQFRRLILFGFQDGTGAFQSCEHVHGPIRIEALHVNHVGSAERIEDEVAPGGSAAQFALLEFAHRPHALQVFLRTKFITTLT